MNDLKERLKNHRLFREITTKARLQLFMSYHVICVWDFMHLVKSLQHQICPSGMFWLPPRLKEPARLINDIVLCEESDLDDKGESKSHFEMYLDAMSEVGASTLAVDLMIGSMKCGNSYGQALQASSLPAAAKTFSQKTLDVLNLPLHCQVAVFYHARESVIPGMFRSIVTELRGQGMRAPKFEHYLNRHIEVDESSHGPMAEKLLTLACEGSSSKMSQANSAANTSLTARLELWDEVQANIETFDATNVYAQGSRAELDNTI